MPRDKDAELKEKIEKIPGCKLSYGGCDPEPGISCSGTLVTQETLSELMSVIREVKGEAEIKLSIYETSLVELDLRPFLKAHFNHLGISHNASLTTIKCPPLEELVESGQKIHAKNIHISFNPLLTDEGFGNTLYCFDPDSAYSLNMWGMKIQGSLRDETDAAPEFLPGLSLMKELGSLEFAMNEIGRVGGGQFRHNNKLSFLNLSQNPIKEIRSNAFHFEPIEASDSYWSIDYRTLVLRLSECQLVPSAFVDGELEWMDQRPIHLQIFNNQLDVLAPDVFERLLKANPENEIIASSNPLVAGDERMKWLNDNKDKYGARVDFEGFKKQE